MTARSRNSPRGTPRQVTGGRDRKTFSLAADEDTTAL